MKKKLLTAGLTMAAIMTITACGSKTTSETTSAPTTAVETTVEESVTSEETDTEAASEEMTAAELTEAKKTSEESGSSAESEAPEEATAEEIVEFAKKVQDAVSVSDIDALAELCDYPVYLSLKAGEGSIVDTKEQFIVLAEDKTFTDEFMAEIAAVKPEELEAVGAGVIMGGESNIIFNKVNGKMAITGINLK